MLSCFLNNDFTLYWYVMYPAGPVVWCSSILHFAEQSIDPEIRASTFSPRLMEVQPRQWTSHLCIIISSILDYCVSFFYWGYHNMVSCDNLYSLQIEGLWVLRMHDVLGNSVYENLVIWRLDPPFILAVLMPCNWTMSKATWGPWSKHASHFNFNYAPVPVLNCFFFSVVAKWLRMGDYRGIAWDCEHANVMAAI